MWFLLFCLLQAQVRMAEAAGSSPIQKQLEKFNQEYDECWHRLDAAQNAEEKIFLQKNLEDINSMRKALVQQLTGRVDMDLDVHGCMAQLHCAQLHVVQCMFSGCVPTHQP